MWSVEEARRGQGGAREVLVAICGDYHREFGKYLEIDR
jgi:hypothetical protein